MGSYEYSFIRTDRCKNSLSFLGSDWVMLYLFFKYEQLSLA